MRTILRLGLIILAVIIGYNYFFGDSGEKTESKEIVEQVKDLGGKIVDLVKNEKERMEEGKYDGIFRNLESVFHKLEQQIDTASTAEKEELSQLETEKEELETQIKESDENETPDHEKQELEDRIEMLMQKTENLMQRLEK